MQIRKADKRDLEAIVTIYSRACSFMASTGNPSQWTNGYPGADIVMEDILQGECLVCQGEDGVEAVFSLKAGEDPAYQTIEGGQWINDLPYVTVHRMASWGRVQGMADCFFLWIQKHYDNVRSDTHKDNIIMQHLLKKHGFLYCGQIYVANGSSRMAYQWHRSSEKK